MDAWTFVLLNYASPTEENPMPTLSHPLSGQKMLSKLYSSWVPGGVPFQRYFTLIYTPLADSHILWTISKPRGVRGMTGEKKKKLVKQTKAYKVTACHAKPCDLQVTVGQQM